MSRALAIWGAFGEDLRPFGSGRGWVLQAVTLRS